jgi:hypothetical protein
VDDVLIGKRKNLRAAEDEEVLKGGVNSPKNYFFGSFTLSPTFNLLQFTPGLTLSKSA